MVQSMVGEQERILCAIAGFSSCFFKKFSQMCHVFLLQARPRIRAVFGELFHMMDHDGSGMITIKEFGTKLFVSFIGSSRLPRADVRFLHLAQAGV